MPRAGAMEPNTLEAFQRHMSRLLASLMIVWLTLGTSFAQEIAGREVYRLGPGDRLRVTVFGERDLSGEFEVGGAGVVSLPLVGEVHAAGLSLREFEAALTSALGDGFLVEPRVSVEVLNYRPFYILGEVKNPGKYPYISGITVLNAVAMAGGYTYRARQGRAEIIRAGETDGILTTTPDATLILPGDVIRIPERFF